MEEKKDWVLAELVVASWRCGCQWYVSTQAARDAVLNHGPIQSMGLSKK